MICSIGFRNPDQYPIPDGGKLSQTCGVCPGPQGVVEDDSRRHYWRRRNLRFLGKSRSRDLSISRSIFGVWGRLRALCRTPGRHTRRAPKTGRYYDL
jgi:hypothetical protein